MEQLVKLNISRKVPRYVEINGVKTKDGEDLVQWVCNGLLDREQKTLKITEDVYSPKTQKTFTVLRKLILAGIIPENKKWFNILGLYYYDIDKLPVQYVVNIELLSD